MPVQTYTDPDTVHNPASGTAAPATWFTTHEANFRSLRSRPGARIRASASQAFTAAANTQATMGTVDYDVGPFTGTANQLTVPSGWGGKYLVSAQWRIDIGGASAGHYCVVAVYLNASTPIASELVHATGAGAVFTCTMSTSTIHALVATDHLRLYVNPDANCSSVNSQPANVYPSLQVMWLAP